MAVEMPKKKEPIPFKDDVTGVACTSYPNHRVVVGVGSDGLKFLKAKQFPIAIRNEETPEQAVSRYRDKILAAKIFARSDAGTS